PLTIQIHRARVEGHAVAKLGGTAHGVVSEIEPLIELTHHVTKPYRVDIEDRGGVGIRAHVGRIARHEENIADAQGMSAENLGLEGEKILVFARAVGDGLDADAL